MYILNGIFGIFQKYLLKNFYEKLKFYLNIFTTFQLGLVLVSGDAKTDNQNGDTIDLDLGASREGKYLFLLCKFFIFVFYPNLLIKTYLFFTRIKNRHRDITKRRRSHQY